MDPVTALATATTAFNILKKGFAIGRDLESMGSDLGRWMGAMGALKEAEHKAKNPPLFKKLVFAKSVEEEAMEAFLAKKKAEDMRNQLREIVIYTRGLNAWQELIKAENDIRKKRKDAEKEQKKAQEEFFFWLIVSILTVCGIALLGWFVYIISLSKGGG